MPNGHEDSKVIWGCHDCTCDFKCRGHLCVHWTSRIANSKLALVSLYYCKHVKHLKECFWSQRCKQKLLRLPLSVFFIHRTPSMWSTLQASFRNRGKKKGKLPCNKICIWLRANMSMSYWIQCLLEGYLLYTHISFNSTSSCQWCWSFCILSLIVTT